MVTITARGGGEGEYLTSASVGDTFTPNEGDVIQFDVNANVATSLSTVTGWGVTFVEIYVFSGVLDRHRWAGIVGPSPGSDTLAITMGSTTFSASVLQIAGLDTSGTVEDIYIQNVPEEKYDPVSPLAIPTLNAFADSNNLSLTVNVGTNANIFTPQSGWTEAIQIVDATATRKIAVMFKDSEDTTHTVEGSEFTFRTIGGVGSELAVEVAGDVIPVTQVVETNIAQAIVAGIGAVSILVGQVTETDIAQPITPLNALVIEVGQVVETNTAQSVTALAGNLDVPVDQVVENNTAQPVTVIQGNNIAVNQVVENDTAQAITVDVGGVSISVNQVSEVNIAQSVTALQGISIAVLQVIETNIAQAVTLITGAVTIEVGQVVETDIAQPIVAFGGVTLTNFKVLLTTQNISANLTTQGISANLTTQNISANLKT